MKKVGEHGERRKSAAIGAHPFFETQRLLDRIANPIPAIPTLRTIPAPLFGALAKQQALVARLREEHERHEAEFARAWRGETVPDPMPRAWPATTHEEHAIELAEHCYRVANFVRFDRGGERERWAQWVSFRECAVSSALAAFALAGGEDAEVVETCARRARVAVGWGSLPNREKAVRMSLYALLNVYRSTEGDDAPHIAIAWQRDAPEVGAVELLRAKNNVSLSRVLESWRRTAKGRRNVGGSLYETLSVFFRSVAGLAKIQPETIESETREARSEWVKRRPSKPPARRAKKARR